MKSAYLARSPAKKGGARQTSRVESLPAPTAGWNTSEPLSATSKATAQVLENWRPTTTGVALRGGSKTKATISLAGAPVISLMSYNGAISKRLFAASETAIYDVTTIANPVVPPSPVVTGQTAGYYSYANFTTSGGAFMTAVNGRNPLLLYEPSAGWKAVTSTSSPAITGLDTGRLSFVWVYRNRQFFIEKESLRAYFLPVGSIGGALGTIDLSGFFQRGGSLLFGATWSMDAGDGLDDKCVFVTSEGEVAVFEGADPSTADKWSQVGRYDIGRPLGPRATMRAGGDLIVCTEDGMVPLSAAVQKDVAALNLASITRPIESDWKKQAIRRRTLPWEVVKWAAKSYAIVSCPVTSASDEPSPLVVNTLTGAWCRYTNWDTRCMVLHDDVLYFGTNDGRVKQAEVGGTDDGAGIYYTCVSNPEHFRRRGVMKSFRQARATFTGKSPFVAAVSASVDYEVTIPSPPGAAMEAATNEWDGGRWNQAVWDGPAQARGISAEWVSIGQSGAAFQYQVQITGGLSVTPDTELISVDVSFDVGATIV